MNTLKCQMNAHYLPHPCLQIFNASLFKASNINASLIDVPSLHCNINASPINVRPSQEAFLTIFMAFMAFLLNATHINDSLMAFLTTSASFDL